MYHLPVSHSPEYADAEDAHYSLAALKWGLQTLITTNKTLQLNDVDNKKWLDVNDHLVPFYVNETGYMIGKDVTLKSSHRHFSHLMQIYLYHLVSLEQPENTELIKKSIKHWMGLNKALAGYSYMGASSMSSLLREGNISYDYLNKFLEGHGTAGGLYAEAGPCFETPPAIANSILEMLLQSWGGKINVFPSVPDEWKNITFDNLRAEGTFLITACHKKGNTEFIKIKRLQGGVAVIETDIPQKQVQISGGGKNNKSLSTLNNKTIIRLATTKGEEIIIQNSLYKQYRVIEQVAITKYSSNYWGLKIK